jgi:hypothetical protein
VATAGHCFDTDAHKPGCQAANGNLAAPPPRSMLPAAMAARPSACPFYFVFDFTDDTQAGNQVTIPGSNVYDCTEVSILTAGGLWCMLRGAMHICFAGDDL